MDKARIAISILTPIFSYGNNSLSEFRITELKALMRSIFRELYLFENLKDMKMKEKELFGNTELKSPVRFRSKAVKGNGMEEMLPHREDKKKRVEISCLKPNTEVNIDIMAKKNQDIGVYLLLLIQASIVGALGRRNRKGFGSFKINKIELNGNKVYSDLLNKSPIEILKEMKELTEKKGYKIQNFNTNIIDNKNEEIKFNRNVDFNHILDYPYVEKVRAIVIEKSEYKQIIKKISKLTHERFGVEFLKDLKGAKIEKNILGYSSGSKRFASPISVSFWENPEKKFLIIKDLNFNYEIKELNIKDENIGENFKYVNKYIEALSNLAKEKE